MRIPFPLSLSVGTDIIAYSRLLKPNVSKSHLRRLALRFMHPIELVELDRRFPEWRRSEDLPSIQLSRFRVHIAGRWAAKEAAKKAWGATLISFKDLRVETGPDGEVQVVCQSYRDPMLQNDGSLDINTQTYEQTAKLSISHDGEYAVATVIATPLHPEIVAELRVRKFEAAAKVAGTK